jgi:ketosteroid isomerase-like protein
MTPRNADRVRAIYEEWGRGNWRRRFFDVYDQHMDWGWSDEFPGLGGVYEDHEDPNPRLRAWLNGWEDWRAEADDFLEIGDYVVVLASYDGRGKGSGVEIHQEGAHVLELRDGKVIRLEIFATRGRPSSRSARRPAPPAPTRTPRSVKRNWGHRTKPLPGAPKPAG